MKIFLVNYGPIRKKITEQHHMNLQKYPDKGILEYPFV